MSCDVVALRETDRMRISPVEIACDMVQRNNALSLLEVGCGVGGIIAAFNNIFYRVGIDNCPCAIEQAKKDNPQIQFLLLDAIHLSEAFPPKLFDVVIAFDFMEHLAPGDFEPVLKQMETIASKLVIVWGPLGKAGMVDFNNTLLASGQPAQHLCILTEKYFDKRGYATVLFPSYWRRYFLDEWTPDGLLAIKKMEG